MYTIFFDHFEDIGPWSDAPDTTVYSRAIVENTRVTVSNISAMDGTSNTILLSENEDAGNWTWHIRGRTPRIPITRLWVNSNWNYTDVIPSRPNAKVEGLVAFTFPSELSSIETGEIPIYRPLVIGGVDDWETPLFINEGRGNVNVVFASAWQAGARTARPSSAHPGVVVAAFVDGGVRTLRDDMDRTLFVRLCRPGSGVIINTGDLGW
jgi:hypothetical protein